MDTKKSWNQCRKKIRYRSEHDANIYRKKCSAERNVELDYYWCGYCNGYHLTSLEFNPEAQGMMEKDGILVRIPTEESAERKAARRYYIGKKNRIRMNIAEFEQLLATS